MRNDQCASRSDNFSVLAVLWLKSRAFLSVADCTHNDFELRVSDNKNLFEICIRIRVSYLSVAMCTSMVFTQHV